VTPREWGAGQEANNQYDQAALNRANPAVLDIDPVLPGAACLEKSMSTAHAHRVTSSKK
jgi:hypothetical protein